ncbi:DUF1214 domain-containing protein [Vibrio chagasii]|nr:DUF1214 domain-containing protein [Vibrio chagasii]
MWLRHTNAFSELQTSQPLPSKNNQRDDFIENEDGSVDLYFGPTAPFKRQRRNWIETVPQRLVHDSKTYGPQEAWYDQTWKPSDIEEVKL